MTTVYNFCKKYALWVFFVLAFALSWGCLLLVIGPGGFMGTEQVDEAKMPLVYLAVLVGPSAAGLLLTGFTQGRVGLKSLRSRLFNWRVGGRWYALAFLTAPLAMVVTLFALSIIYPTILPGIALADNALSFILTGIAGGLSAGIFEELGWTGFAVPQLRQRYGILQTGLVMGLLWGAWHFPLFVGNGRTAPDISPIIYLAVLLFSFLPAYRVIMVWIYDRTQSLFIAMLMHMSLTASTLIFQPQVIGLPALIFDLILAAILWGTVAVIALANSGQLAHTPLKKRTI